MATRPNLAKSRHEVLRLDRRLRAFVDRARVDCENMFEFECPMYWGELDEMQDPAVRFCGSCQRRVYLVMSEAEFRHRARRGQCVAVIAPSELPDPEGVPAETPGMVLGRPSGRW